MKKIAILISLPILVFSFSNFATNKTESLETVITTGGAMVTFAGKRSGEITKETALITTELFAKYPKDGKIISFKLIIPKEGKVVELSAKGGKLTGEMITCIKKMEKGGSIKFSNIKVEWREGKSIPAPNISLKLI